MGLFRSASTPSEKRIVAYIRKHFGYKPKKVSLYQQALRHKSAAKEIRKGLKNSNERLEFLGDSILDAIVADYLFKTYPYKDEGYLTKLRSRFVSRQHLNKLATKMGLDELLEKKLHVSVKHKSLNGNALEALIGAIYLEKGYKFTRKIIISKVLETKVDLVALVQNETNFKSRLLEWSQKERRKVAFRVTAEEDLGYQKKYEVEVLVDDEVVSQGKGTSKKEAEQDASKKAVELLLPSAS